MAVQPLRRRRSHQQLEGTPYRSAPPRARPSSNPPTTSSSTNEIAASTAHLAISGPRLPETSIRHPRTRQHVFIWPLTDADLDELIGAVAAEANHEPNRRRQQRLDAAFDTLNSRRRRLRVVNQMALPDFDVARVQRWCAARVPEHARHQVRVECDIAARHLTIVERRAPWREDYGPEWTSFPIARLRYTATTKTWILYWRDRNLTLPPLRPTRSLAPSRRSPHRTRPRPHLHLLGLTVPPDSSNRLQSGAKYGRHSGANSS